MHPRSVLSETVNAVMPDSGTVSFLSSLPSTTVVLPPEEPTFPDLLTFTFIMRLFVYGKE
jgi:hypothetical protein